MGETVKTTLFSAVMWLILSAAVPAVAEPVVVGSVRMVGESCFAVHEGTQLPLHGGERLLLADTLGSKERNYTLSLQGAQAVAALWTAAGVAPEILEIISHGEENLLIPAADGIDKPQNRRVEIAVR